MTQTKIWCGVVNTAIGTRVQMAVTTDRTKLGTLQDIQTVEIVLQGVMMRQRGWSGVENTGTGTIHRMDAILDILDDFVIVPASIFDKVVHDFAKYEQGAILGCRQGEKRICAYYYDEIGSALSKHNEYTPCSSSLEKIVSYWMRSDIVFWGILHSHPLACNNLSRSDILYAVEFCKINQINFVHMVLYIPVMKQMWGYRVFSNGFVSRINVISNIKRFIYV